MKNQLRLNPAQLQFHSECFHVKVSYQIWGRSTGKSSYGIGIVIRNIIHFLPRSKWLIVAESYKAMLENTLPATVAALEGLGYFRNVHYVLGIQPSKWWPSSYEPPTKGFSSAITFLNGTMFQLISQDSAATSSRGLNTDGVIVDEALNLDKDAFDEEISPTVRANRLTFKKIPFHHGRFFFSSMPYGNNAEWLTGKNDYYAKDGVDNQRIMNMLIDAQVEFLEEGDSNRKGKLWDDCLKIRRLLRWYPKKIDGVNTFYMESNSFDNIRVNGYNYINGLYRETSHLKFMTEVMNKRMNKIEGGFYAKFDRPKHTYKRYWMDETKGVFDDDYLTTSIGDAFDYSKVSTLGCLQDRDCIANEPLYLGVDFGGNINCAVVGQQLPSLNRFNFIKDFYVKSPSTLDELAEEIATYYQYHATKQIYFYYDRNGNNSVANSKYTYAEQFANILIANGFDVFSLTQGLNPEHHLKYLLWSRILGTSDTVNVAFNFYNCQNLIYSIEGTKAKEGKRDGLIVKDKSGEGKHLETEEREPHLSDAADYIIYPIYKRLLKGSLEFIENQIR